MALTKGSGFGVASSSGGAAASGGTITAIASGTIPNGKPVILQSDGTVKAVEGHSTGFGNVASSSSIQYDIQSNFLTEDKTKIFITWRNGSTMQASVGTVDGTTLTFGTVNSIGPSSTSYTSSATDGKGNWMCTYHRYNYNDWPYVVCGTFSDTDTLQIGSASTLTTVGSSRSSCVYHPGVNKFYIVWSCHNGGFRSFASSTPNGTSTTFSSADPIDSTSYGNGSYMWYDSTHEKIGIIYQPTSSTTYINGIDLNSSGTATEGTRYQINNNSDQVFSGCHHSDLGLNVVVYTDKDDSNKSKLRTFDLNGNTPSSVGTELEVTSGGSFQWDSLGINYSTGTNTVILVFRNYNDSYYGWVLPVTVSGASTIVVGTPTKHTEATGLVNPSDSEKYAWDDDNKKLVYHGTGKGSIWRQAGSNVNADNFIGIPTTAVANGGSATVTVIGGVSENQSGLTIGKSYFINDDGTLSETATTKPRAGIAIAANKLLIR
mgnify:CR=1 FL=1